jgi:uncharacterized protein DUF6980
MEAQLTRECDLHSRADCPDVAVLKYPSAQGPWYGIPIRDGGTSTYKINYCPWCGVQL